MVVASGCVLVAYKFRFHPFSSWSDTWVLMLDADRPYYTMMLLAPIVRLLSGYSNGLYRYPRRGYRFGEDLPQVFRSVSIGTAFLIILAFFGFFQYQSFSAFREFSYARFFFFFDWLLNLVLLVAIHPLVHILRTEIARRGMGLRRLAVQGFGIEARRLAAKRELLREHGYELVGIIAEDFSEPSIEIEGEAIPYLGGVDDVLATVNAHDLDEIVVTNMAALGRDVFEFAEKCHKVDVVVQLAPNLQGLLFQNQPVTDFEGIPVIQVSEISITGLPSLLKRMEDILISAIALIVFSPVFFLAAVCIRWNSPGPVLFSQRRTGKNGRVFMMYKFRSMFRDAEQRKDEVAHLNESDGPVFKIKNDPRITPVGRFIRKTSIDELPQLFNVLRGDMSLVGPRPLPATDIQVPDTWEEMRFAAIPGITGMWQVNRLDHSSEEMLKWDLYYVEHWSLWLDLKILLKTVVVVFSGKGAY